MRFTVYGAGAIGGSLGAYMVRAGEEVVFVDKNEEHVRRMNTGGLKMDGHGGEFVVPVTALRCDQLKQAPEVVLLAVKSQHTEEAVQQMVPMLDKHSVVISAQNGLNEDIIASLIGAERTIGAFVNWAADYIGPGHIRLGGKGSFYIGELDGRISDRLRELQKPLSALFPVHLTDNIMGYLWSKQVDASVLFATALTDLSIPQVVETPDIQSLMGDMVREAMQVPTALGITLERFDEFDPSLYVNHQDAAAMEKVAAQYRHNIKNKTGVWRDLAVRKRKTEVDGIIGQTVRQGEALGLSLPLNRRLIELIHELEEGARVMNIENFKDLDVRRSSSS